MISRIQTWILERWPIETVIRWSLEEEMPGGSSFFYIFGSSLFLIFALQIVTGIWQLIYFIPTLDHAYDSLNYLRIQVPFGWLVHGLHYWGASAMVVMMALHMSRVFLWGAYKNPRQLTWLIGVFLMLFTFSLAFTGPALPWDERGYWEAEVGTSIAGTVPYVGNFLRELLRGGPDMGQLTLSRFFILHVAILPGVLAALIVLHVTAFRRFGISGPWDPVKRRRVGTFWPDQLFKDGLVFAGIFVVLVALSAYWRPPMTGPADPLDTSYRPKPEWYFLFLYQTLKIFKGTLEPVGTIGIPLAGALLLLFLPFFDRNPQRSMARRPAALVGYLLAAAWIISAQFIGYESRPGTAGASPQTATPQAPATDPPAKTINPLPPSSAAPSAKIPQGPLGASADTIGYPLSGAVEFQKICASCHGTEGTDKVPNPGSSLGTVPALNPIDRRLFNQNPQIFVENIDPFIQHGATPAGPHPALRMLPFGDSHTLTQAAIANVEAYILELNGVDRGKILHPGLPPRQFFFIVLSAYVMVLAGIGGWVYQTGKKPK